MSGIADHITDLESMVESIEASLGDEPTPSEQEALLGSLSQAAGKLRDLLDRLDELE